MQYVIIFHKIMSVLFMVHMIFWIAELNCAFDGVSYLVLRK